MSEGLVNGQGFIKGYWIGPGADLSAADLSGAFLTGADLRGANLSGADLSGAFLLEANLSGANLEGAIFVNAKMEMVNLKGANLRGAIIKHADLSGACLTGADFTSAKIEWAKFYDMGLHEVCFEGAEIANAFFNSCAISRCNFNNATLSSNLTKKDLINNKNEIRHFTSTVMWESTFIGTVFDRIKFEYNNFYKLNIQNALFTESALVVCSFELCDVKNLEFSSCYLNCISFHNDMENLKIINSELQDSSFIGSDFPGVVMEGSELDRNIIRFCDFRSSTIRKCVLDGIDFFGSVLDGSDLSDSSMKEPRLAGASFRGVTFKDGKIIGECFDLCARPIDRRRKGGFIFLRNLAQRYFGLETGKNTKDGFIDEDSDELTAEQLEAFIESGTLKSANPWTKDNHAYEVDKGDFDLADEIVGALKHLFEACPEAERILDERFLHYRKERNIRERAWLNTTVGKSRGLYYVCTQDKKNVLTAMDFTGSNLDGIKFLDSMVPAGLSLVDCSLVGATIRYTSFLYADFTGADFAGSRLVGSDFMNVVLKDVNLEKCSLAGSAFRANFKGANFKGVKFLGAKFYSCDLSKAKNLNQNTMARCTIKGTALPPGFKQPTHVNINGMAIGPNASFPGANLHGADLSGLDLKNVNFEGADLGDADFLYSDIKDSNLSGANLEGSKFFSTHIWESNLSGAKMMRSRFGGQAGNAIVKSDLSGADFSGAKIDYTGIRRSNLKKANLSKTKSKDLDVHKSDLSGLSAEGAIMQDPKFSHSDLTGANFSGSKMRLPKFISNKLNNVSFENTKLRTPKFNDNRYNKTSFRGAELEYPMFNGRRLGTSDFTDSKIKEPTFENSMDARKATFKNTQITFSDSEGHAAFMTPNLMSKGMREVLKDDITKSIEARSKAVKSDKRYLGERTGLWIHQTHEPQTSYYGELCVSPYEPGEPIFERRGIYGVVFEGTSPLFNIDVWSSKNRYGMLVPGRTPPTWADPFKEGFLDAQLSKLVQLNVLKGFEDPNVIKKFKDKGIPVKVVEGSEATLKAFAKIDRPSEKQLEKARGLIDGSSRESNPGHCCMCGQVASAIDRGGNLFCRKCF